MKKKMDNKGFSLVELIIVIAIMLVLVGILAPQFIKYVARSRVAADVTNAQEIAAAINVAIADGETWSIGASGATIGSGDEITAGTVVNGLPGFTKMPTSKVNSARKWIIIWNSVDGVTEIKLGNGVIYPESSAYENGGTGDTIPATP